MSNKSLADYASLFEDLQHAFVTQVQYNKSVIQIDFALEGADFANIRLSEIVHLVYSQTLADEGAYFVGELSLTQVSDGGKEVLSTLHYRFFDQNKEVFSYPSEQLFHFHLEGDICLEVVCGAYELYKSVGS